MSKFIGVLLLIIGFLGGIVLQQARDTYQGKSAQEWANSAQQSQLSIQENQKKLSYYTEKLSSVSAQMKSLLNAPTPTPNIKYVSQPSTQTTTSSDVIQPQIPDWKYLDWNSGACKAATPEQC